PAPTTKGSIRCSLRNRVPQGLFAEPPIGPPTRLEPNKKGRRWRRPFAIAMERVTSAGRLAAACDADLLLQAVKADSADHDLLADHIARRTVQPHVFGELEVLFDGCLDLGAGEIFLDLRGVEASVLCRGHRPGLVRRTAAAEQLLVEVEIFLAGGILH